jgi:hypothetical protein
MKRDFQTSLTPLTTRVAGNIQNRRAILPLPGGEGRGEGKRKLCLYTGR